MCVLPGAVGSKKCSTAPLRRPVIAICNDIHVPALRPLRDVAQVVHFKPPASDKLVKRLAIICEAEGVKVEAQVTRARFGGGGAASDQAS